MRLGQGLELLCRLLPARMPACRPSTGQTIASVVTLRRRAAACDLRLTWGWLAGSSDSEGAKENGHKADAGGLLCVSCHLSAPLQLPALCTLQLCLHSGSAMPLCFAVDHLWTWHMIRQCGAGSSQYQTVELKFQAPAAGKYDLTLLCVSGRVS